MNTIATYQSCSTSGVRALDLQLIAQIQKIAPGLLVKFDYLQVAYGPGCHPYLQAPAVKALEKVVAMRSEHRLKINSAYRTLAQQALLFAQYQQRRCGVVAAARPGQSNHNSGLSLDIDEASIWRPTFERCGFDWLGSWDPMHFDFVGSSAKDLRWVSIKAFQQLWNLNHPKQKIAEDGKWGEQTFTVLMRTTISGFMYCPSLAVHHKVPAITTNPNPLPSLRKGMSGLDVVRLQTALAKKQLVGIEPDGVFGNRTEDAVKSIQRSVGITADGVVGLATRKALGLG